ncbi:HAT, C-terminal dimerisation domain [Cinara cedri]|uniref:HAT, C-terminal dimerisation domain n=1 Tax=Cinara cedri TaxID=506608 RepID=A0A5E4M523_9HEMI|nr:HAT, C-terminal dimerisation domain [Cinara cedri]
MKVLNNIILTGRTKYEQNDATTLKSYFESYETVILILLMYKILSKINIASKILQSPEADIGKAADLIKSTLQIIEAIRMNIDILIEEANNKALKWNVTPQFSNKRTIKVKRFYDELCQDQRLSQGCQYFKIQVLYRCIDTVVTQMQTRYVELESCNSVFDMTKLLVIENYNLITSFPDLLTTFYLFLTLPVTVASAERLFSKLKLIKSYLRNTMSQTRLSGLAMISIENERAKKLNMSALIKSFAQDRSRKKLF